MEVNNTNPLLTFYKSLSALEKQPGEDDKIVDLMLDLFDANFGKFSINQMIDDKRGDTLLHKAVRQGDARIMTALLIKDASPDVLNYCDETPRTLSINTQLQNIFAVMAPKKTSKPCAPAQPVCPKLVVNPVIDYTHQGFFEAITTENTPVVKLYLKNASRTLLMTVDADGRSAMHLAARSGSYEVVNLFVDAVLPVDKKDKNGCSPLSYAAGRNHHQIVRLLLSRVSDRNDVDNKMQTALHVAAQKGHLESVQLLAKSLNGDHISKGVSMKDAQGKLPIDLARENGCSSVVEYLVSLEPKKEVEEIDLTSLKKNLRTLIEKFKLLEKLNLKDEIKRVGETLKSHKALVDTLNDAELKAIHQEAMAFVERANQPAPAENVADFLGFLKEHFTKVDKEKSNK